MGGIKHVGGLSFSSIHENGDFCLNAALFACLGKVVRIFLLYSLRHVYQLSAVPLSVYKFGSCCEIENTVGTEFGKMEKAG